MRSGLLSATSGPLTFARYAYPPNALGLCGPLDPDELWWASVGGADVKHLGHLATQFEGAWPYLELIAGANSIKDPLDSRVVEAYWIGNKLTSRVPMNTLAYSLQERFRRRTGQKFDFLVAAALAGGVAQHSFHVFAVYPWLGLLRAGLQGPPLEVLDRCRIRWGRIESLNGDVATVTSQSLSFVGSRLVLDLPRLEQVRCGVGNAGLINGLSPGDTVALHWDWVCDRLTPRSFAWLRACTLQNLAAVNNLAVPSPAMICGA